MGYIGEFCALLTAISYVSASTLFSQTIKSCSPLLLNLLRGSVAIVLNFLTLCIFSDKVFPSNTVTNYILLILSGILGIAVGDTFYFTALKYIGARKTILLETLAPTFTGLISYFYFGQTIPLLGWGGIILTCLGISIVVNEKESKQDNENEEIELEIELADFNQGQDRLAVVDTQASTKNDLEYNNQQESKKFKLSSKKKIYGMFCGVGFTVCQALGMVLSYDGMRSGQFSSFQSSLIRIISGTVGVALIFAIKKGEQLRNPCKTYSEYKIFFIASTLNCFIGLWAQQTSVIYTKPEISQTIMATTPLFSLGISWYQGEVMKFKYFIGSILAIIGVGLIVWN